MTRMATTVSCNLCLNSYFQNVGVNNDVMHSNQMKCETSVHVHSSKCAHSDTAHYSSRYHLMVVKTRMRRLSDSNMEAQNGSLSNVFQRSISLLIVDKTLNFRMFCKPHIRSNTLI